MKKSTWLLLIPVLFSYGYAAGLGAETPTAEELFLDANRAYQEGRFQDAINGYLRLIADGYKNGHLYYNLGNAYFRTNQLGRAILYYERAHLQMPRDADLSFNLRYALDRTQDAISPDRNYLEQAFFWLDDMTLHELL